MDYNNFLNNNNSKSETKRIKAKVVEVDSTNTNAVVETVDSATRVKLYNKSGEILSVGDYVGVEYSKILSSKNGYIYMRNGQPEFTAYLKVLTQSEYNALNANNEIISGVLYVILKEEDMV